MSQDLYPQDLTKTEDEIIVDLINRSQRYPTHYTTGHLMLGPPEAFAGSRNTSMVVAPSESSGMSWVPRPIFYDRIDLSREIPDVIRIPYPQSLSVTLQDLLDMVGARFNADMAKHAMGDITINAPGTVFLRAAADSKVWTGYATIELEGEVEAPAPTEDLSFIIPNPDLYNGTVAELFRKQNGDLLHGTGNPSTFVQLKNNGEIEIGGSARLWRDIAVFPPVSGIYHCTLGAIEGAGSDWNFLLTAGLVNKTNSEVMTDLYDITLDVTCDQTEGSLNFVLNRRDGAYFLEDTANDLSITDGVFDAVGSYYQEMQRVSFYKNEIGNPPEAQSGAPIGLYTFTMRAVRKTGGFAPVEVVWQANVVDGYVVPVPPEDLSFIIPNPPVEQVLPSEEFMTETGNLLNGSGNPSTDLLVLNNGEIEMGGSVRLYRDVNTITPDGNVYNVVLTEMEGKGSDWSIPMVMGLVNTTNGEAITDLYNVSMTISSPDANDELNFELRRRDGAYFFEDDAHDLSITDAYASESGHAYQDIQRVSFYATEIAAQNFAPNGKPIGEYTITMTAERLTGEFEPFVVEWVAVVTADMGVVGPPVESFPPLAHKTPAARDGLQSDIWMTADAADWIAEPGIDTTPADIRLHRVYGPVRGADVVALNVGPENLDSLTMTTFDTPLAAVDAGNQVWNFSGPELPLIEGHETDTWYYYAISSTGSAGEVIAACRYYPDAVRELEEPVETPVIIAHQTPYDVDGLQQDLWLTTNGGDWVAEPSFLNDGSPLVALRAFGPIHGEGRPSAGSTVLLSNFDEHDLEELEGISAADGVINFPISDLPVVEGEVLDTWYVVEVRDESQSTGYIVTRYFNEDARAAAGMRLEYIGQNYADVEANVFVIEPNYSAGWATNATLSEVGYNDTRLERVYGPFTADSLGTLGERQDLSAFEAIEVGEPVHSVGSTDYGYLVYDLERLAEGDTYYLLEISRVGEYNHLVAAIYTAAADEGGGYEGALMEYVDDGSLNQRSKLFTVTTADPELWVANRTVPAEDFADVSVSGVYGPYNIDDIWPTGSRRLLQVDDYKHVTHVASHYLGDGAYGLEVEGLDDPIDGQNWYILQLAHSLYGAFIVATQYGYEEEAEAPIEEPVPEGSVRVHARTVHDVYQYQQDLWMGSQMDVMPNTVNPDSPADYTVISAEGPYRFSDTSGAGGVHVNDAAAVTTFATPLSGQPYGAGVWKFTPETELALHPTATETWYLMVVEDVNQNRFNVWTRYYPDTIRNNDSSNPNSLKYIGPASAPNGSQHDLWLGGDETNWALQPNGGIDPANFAVDFVYGPFDLADLPTGGGDFHANSVVNAAKRYELANAPTAMVAGNDGVYYVSAPDLPVNEVEPGNTWYVIRLFNETANETALAACRYYPAAVRTADDGSEVPYGPFDQAPVGVTVHSSPTGIDFAELPLGFTDSVQHWVPEVGLEAEDAQTFSVDAFYGPISQRIATGDTVVLENLTEHVMTSNPGMTPHARRIYTINDPGLPASEGREQYFIAKVSIARIGHPIYVCLRHFDDQNRTTDGTVTLTGKMQALLHFDVGLAFDGQRPNWSVMNPMAEDDATNSVADAVYGPYTAAEVPALYDRFIPDETKMTTLTGAPLAPSVNDAMSFAVNDLPRPEEGRDWYIVRVQHTASMVGPQYMATRYVPPYLDDQMPPLVGNVHLSGYHSVVGTPYAGYLAYDPATIDTTAFGPDFNPEDWGMAAMVAPMNHSPDAVPGTYNASGYRNMIGFRLIQPNVTDDGIVHYGDWALGDGMGENAHVAIALRRLDFADFEERYILVKVS